MSFWEKVFNSVAQGFAQVTERLRNANSHSADDAGSAVNKTKPASFFNGWFSKSPTSASRFNQNTTSTALFKAAQFSDVSQADVNEQLIRDAARYNFTNEAAAINAAQIDEAPPTDNDYQ